MSPLVVAVPAEIQAFRDYLLQLRQEVGARLAQKLFTAEGPSPVFKLWTMYNKKRFMSLTYTTIN